jgi:hypothetical protein
VAGEAGRCRHDRPIGACLRDHVRALVPLPHPKSGADRECPVCRKPLSINIGSKGQRFVWNCATNCDPVAVRECLEDLGVDPVCLGNYGSATWERSERRKERERPAAADSATLAAARRSYVFEKLIEGDFRSVAELKTAMQAVKESDGNVSPEPDHLLPRDYSERAALARRAGIARRNSYKVAEATVPK